VLTPQEDGTVGDGQIDGVSADAQLDPFCLRNNGTVPIQLSTTFANNFDSEISACDTDEAAVDATCAVGDEGELSGNLTIDFAGFPETESGPPPCQSSAAFSGYVTGQTLGTIAPGARCIARMEAYWTNDPAGRQVSQTDRLQWEIIFSAVGAPT
jgi:hypothetical protein